MSLEPDPLTTYRKVPFEWVTGQMLFERPQIFGSSWIESDADQRFVDVVARSLAVSQDASDKSSVESMGAVIAARTLLDSAPKWKCSRAPDWWRLLCCEDEPVGFVLPVTYDVSPGVGQLEGTIFHTGVIPEYRGRGFGRLLLREAVRILVGSGAQRIFCDTDETNAPMIHLFESEGWRRLAVREVPMPLGFEPGT
jgi:ribosomal protein S18 acetylase RimI-like enzyme